MNNWYICPICFGVFAGSDATVDACDHQIFELKEFLDVSTSRTWWTWHQNVTLVRIELDD